MNMIACFQRQKTMFCISNVNPKSSTSRGHVLIEASLRDMRGMNDMYQSDKRIAAAWSRIIKERMPWDACLRIILKNCLVKIMKLLMNPSLSILDARAHNQVFPTKDANLETKTSTVESEFNSARQICWSHPLMATSEFFLTYGTFSQ